MKKTLLSEPVDNNDAKTFEKSKENFKSASDRDVGRSFRQRCNMLASSTAQKDITDDSEALDDYSHNDYITKSLSRPDRTFGKPTAVSSSSGKTFSVEKQQSSSTKRPIPSFHDQQAKRLRVENDTRTTEKEPVASVFTSPISQSERDTEGKLRTTVVSPGPSTHAFSKVLKELSPTTPSKLTPIPVSSSTIAPT